MNRHKTYCISAIIIFLTLTVTTTSASNRIALVIGNSNYQESPLQNPVNDAKDMQKVLQKLGFTVLVETDASLKQMHKALNRFSKTLKQGDVALFFYAGHGVQVDGMNYLLPVDYSIDAVSDVRYQALPVGQILGRMEEAHTMNIIMLDACRNNPLGRGFSRSLDRGLAVVQNKPDGSFIAYATAPGKTAADGDGRNGLFTSALLKHMETPNHDIGRLFIKIRAEVKQKSLGDQIPWTESSLTTEFYLVSASGSQVNNNKLQAERDRIAKEPKELANLKAEIAELKRLEEERLRLQAEKKKLLLEKPIKISSIAPAMKTPKIIARDGQYVKYENGIVYDKNTGLEWLVGQDKDTNWNGAKSWVASLSTGGGEWRMPNKSELKNLYKKGTGSRNMTSLLSTTGWWVWSGVSGWSGGWYFNFYWGRGPGLDFALSYPTRAFAVRSRKQ